MNDRERHVQCLLFGEVDRIPFAPGGGRQSTRDRWHAEGLPEDVQPHQITEYAYRQVGGTLDMPKGGEQFPVKHRMIPEFEEKVIERRERSLVVQDWKGNVCEISDEYGVEYLRNAIDFVTRAWLKCPVESRQDWEDMKRRYDAEAPERLPENPAELGKRLADRDHVVSVAFHGPFWQIREWTGFEQLCMMLVDDPDFVHEMAYFWQEYVARLLERTFEYITPDFVHISEDMAYKSFSMISPKMVREFLVPSYKRWGELIRNAGVPIFDCDSDGFIGELIPIWIECGINVCDPIEVAAGNDINEFRKKFGKNMGYRGGVDKRCMAKGGAILEQEMARIDLVIKGGGFIPGCDHGIPSDVSWKDFLHYIELLAKTTGWL